MKLFLVYIVELCGQLMKLLEAGLAHPVAAGTGVTAGGKTLQIGFALLQACHAFTLHAGHAHKYKIVLIARGTQDVVWIA